MSRQKTIHYTKLVALCGKPVSADALPKTDFIKAVHENRVVSIHDGCGDDDYAQVGYYIVNCYERIVFPKPLPVKSSARVHGFWHFFDEPESPPRYLTRQSPDVEDEEGWKLDLGAQCNRLLDAADWMEKNNVQIGNTPNSIKDDLRSIVERVAEFEQLETDKSNEH